MKVKINKKVFMLAVGFSALAADITWGADMDVKNLVVKSGTLNLNGHILNCS